ncbi:VTT domain-containing protein [Povalibacter sp.]|uniref:VTT domain-containing protein n=1 Tax=Povalibacter sp. TaxID=1962978 RepID=UPI002F3FFAA0
MPAGSSNRKLSDAPSDAAFSFEPGRNCWCVEQATRAAFLVDGDAYFKAFVAAARKAQRSILIAGWDFHSRTRILCGGEGSDCDLELGDFLNRLAQERRDLEIHILIWDYPMIFGMDREWAPIYGLGWKPHRRVHFRYDNTHPVGGSHHQKVVVIDDNVAFNGGIDLTCRRWDTCAHDAHDRLRKYEGMPYPPFHDMMMAVEGDAARALGDLVRERWRIATGDRLRPPTAPRRMDWARRQRAVKQRAESRWPEELAPDICDVPVAISRTSPPVNGHSGTREVEALYIDMIAAARHSIYLENQYFTAEKIGAAIEARLAEPEGPEIILVLRKLSHGWLEELTMEALRTRLIERLKAADSRGRLKVVYPYIEGLTEGTCIDIHSKMIIVDDAIVRIGSANIANRSMGLDTECDLTIAADGREDVQEAIRALRASLLGEHLGQPPERVQEVISRTGSLCSTLVELQQDSRTLRDLEGGAQTSEGLLNVLSVADPERPVGLSELAKIFSADDAAEPARAPAGPAWGKIALIAGVLIGLTALWQLTPLSELLDAQRIIAWAQAFGGLWWAPIVTILAYTPACLVMFPRAPITLFAVVAFGPWLGFTYAMLGLEFAAWSTYAAGQQLDRDTVRRLAGRKLNDIIQVLRRRGLIAITALRLVPLAPFSVEGVVAGAVGIKLWHFLLGSAIGMLPGTLVATVFGDQLHGALIESGHINYWLLGSVLLATALATWWVRRWLLTSARQLRAGADGVGEQRISANHGVGRAREA